MPIDELRLIHPRPVQVEDVGLMCLIKEYTLFSGGSAAAQIKAARVNGKGLFTRYATDKTFVT